MDESEARQRDYYRETAARYEHMHVGERDEHAFALHFAMGMFNYLDIQSVLDVGSGTGRALSMIQKWRPDIRALGIEPVKELREQGYLRGLSREQLLDGDGRALPFSDGEFDLVCSFGVLHHVRSPDVILGEMIRVARKAVLVSDNNIYGDRSPVARLVKNTIRIFGLWKLAVFLRTGGRGFVESDIDGIAYYYSVFDAFDLLKSKSSSVHFINTNPWTGVGKNMLWTANNVAVLAVLK